jgi:hypothetical protein
MTSICAQYVPTCPPPTCRQRLAEPLLVLLRRLGRSSAASASTTTPALSTNDEIIEGQLLRNSQDLWIGGLCDLLITPVFLA